MSAEEFIKEYLSELEEEVFVRARDAKVLFTLIEEFRGKLEKETLEKDSFLDALNMFEDVLDAKILTFK